jgi:hypothetical protein
LAISASYEMDHQVRLRIPAIPNRDEVRSAIESRLPARLKRIPPRTP